MDSGEKPRILSRKSLPGLAIGQCDCDCDCACEVPGIKPDQRGSTDIGLRLNPVSWAFWENAPTSPERLVASPELYKKELSSTHWFVFNPFADSGVAVLNSAAVEILQAFSAPRALNEVIRRFDNVGKPEIERTTSQLVTLSLLVEEGQGVKAKPRSSMTLAAWMHITNDCNLRCTYCYLRKTPDEMTLDIGKRSVNAVFRSAITHRFKAVKLKFSGGEATLNFPLILHLHDYAQQLANSHGVVLESVVLSNGVALTDRMIDEMVKRDIKMMISLDGIGEYHDAQRVFFNGRGSFAIVSRTVERLIKEDLVPDISVTITNKSVDGLADTTKYLLDHNVPFSLNFYRENDCSASFEELRYSDERAIDGMRRAFSVIEANLPERSLLGGIIDKAHFIHPHNRTCGVGDNYLVIDQHGRIAKCQMDITNTITSINAEDPLRDIREDQNGIQNLPVKEKEGCRDCIWRNWCAGGCPLYTYRVTGRYDIKSPNCRIYKALYPEALRLEALRLLRYARCEC